jgi:hypothetical protein
MRTVPTTAVTERRGACDGVTYTVRDADTLKAALRAARISRKTAGAIADCSPSTIDHLTSGRQTRCLAPIAVALMTAIDEAGVDGADDLFVAPQWAAPRRRKRKAAKVPAQTAPAEPAEAAS